jgi:hypothetical protein
MIRIKPDKLTKTKYKTIDFSLLEHICNILFTSYKTNKRSYTIHIKGVKGDECSYLCGTRGRLTIKIITNLKNDSSFIKYFLHEFRHFLQDKIFRVAFDDTTYNDTTYETYINSPLEVDVKNFLDDHLKDSCKIYGKMKIYKDKLLTSRTGKAFTGFNSDTKE